MQLDPLTQAGQVIDMSVAKIAVTLCGIDSFCRRPCDFV